MTSSWWWFSLVFSLFIPVLMIALSPYMKKTHRGYHSRRSLRTEESNIFANEYCAKLWWRLGWAMAAPSLIAILLCLKADEKTMGTVFIVVLYVQMAVLLLTIVLVERALKEKFGK